MSTVKISQLPELLHLDTNTANTILIGVDVSSCVTSQLTVQTLAEGLYANNVLNVGNNEILFPGVIAQFVGNSSNYLQVNLQNNDANASADYVVTSDIGNDSSYYIDMGIKNSTFNYVGDTASKPLDSYIYSQGDSANSLGGNLVIGTTSSGRAINFLAGGTANSDIIIRMTAAAGLELLQKPIIFADGTSQNTSSLSAGSYANAAFLKANSAYDSQNTSGVYANAAFLKANSSYTSQNVTGTYANSAFLKANSAYDSQNTTGVYANSAFLKANTPAAIANSAALYANGAFVQANAAFIVANNALANATGTFAGDLNIQGNLVASSITTSNLVSFVGSSTPSTNALVEIIGSSGGVQQTPSNDGYMLHVTGKANTPVRIVFDGFGANAYPLIAGRTGRGTALAPTAVQNGDILMRIAGNGWGTDSFASLGSSRIDFVASENFTNATRGTKIVFYNTIDGSNTLTSIATFNANNVTFTGTVNPTKGFIFTPRLPVGNQTTIAIDYSTDSTIKANLVADLTITHTNFLAGKVIDVWLVNASGLTRTITHGIAAINSTVNATTFTMPSTSSAHLRFFSIDGDIANTFVSIAP